MNNLKAPIAVFTLGLAGAILVGELGVALLTTAIALMGYGINKAGN
jgi:hypothetical protein